MAMTSVMGVINHSTTIYRMMRTELQQEKRHASNHRCKPASWDGVANYIEYATGVKATGEEVRAYALQMNID